MKTIVRNIFETVYITGEIEMEVKIVDVQGKQVKLEFEMGQRSYISTTKVTRGRGKPKLASSSYNNIHLVRQSTTPLKGTKHNRKTSRGSR